MTRKVVFLISLIVSIIVSQPQDRDVLIQRT